MQTAGSVPDLMSTTLFATLPVPRVANWRNSAQNGVSPASLVHCSASEDVDRLIYHLDCTV